MTDEVGEMATYAVEVKGFGRVSVKRVEAATAAEARQKACDACGVSVRAKRLVWIEGQGYRRS